MNNNQSSHMLRTDHCFQSRPSSPPSSPQAPPSALHHATTTLQDPQPLHHITHKLHLSIGNGATILDHRLHLRRNLRSPRRLRCPRPQETHRGPRETSKLGHCCAVSGMYPIYKISFQSICYFLSRNYRVYLINFPLCPHLLVSYLDYTIADRMEIVTSFNYIDVRRRHCASKHHRHVALHGRNDDVQRFYLLVDVRSSEIQVSGTCYADWRPLLDWRLGCVGYGEETGFS
jgi:hypothetical protein